MAALLNLARVTTATTGTGSVVLGAALSGFLTFAQAGAVDGREYAYAIRDGANSEVGRGVYTSATQTLTRTVRKSTNSDTAISLSGSAEVLVTPSAEDLQSDIALEDGTIAAPSLAFRTDDDLGLYRIGANEAGFSTGGAGTGYGLSATAFYPITNDAWSLGKSGNAVADAFFASGAVLNFNAGNYTLTHSAGLLTASGPFSLGTSNALTAGTVELGHASDTTIARVSAGLVSVEGDTVALLTATQTLSSKTLTAPDINGGTADSLTSLSIRSTGAAFDLLLATSEVLTANRTLSWVMGDAARTVTLSGSPTLADWFDQSVKVAASPQFAAVNIGHATDTTVARVSAGLISVEGDTVALLTATQTLTNKTLTAPSITGTVALAAGVTLSWASGGVTIQEVSDELQFRGAAALGYSFDNFISPPAADGASLGTATRSWSDLFLAAGGVINWDSGNATITHSTGALGFVGVVDVQQAFRWSGDISPSQITANQNDYNPTGLSTASVLRLSTDASRNITSLAGGADGRIVIAFNVGAQNIVFTDDDGSTGTAANRFALASNITIAGDQTAAFWYDSTSSRWRSLTTPVSVPGSDTQLIFNDGGSFGGDAGLTYNKTTNFLTAGGLVVTENGAASTPPVSLTGTWFTGGSATTTKPQLLVQPTGTTSTGWSTSGTGLGINAASGFAGNLIDAQVAGTSFFRVNGSGEGVFGGALMIGGTDAIRFSKYLSNVSAVSYNGEGGGYVCLVNSAGIAMNPTMAVAWQATSLGNDADTFAKRATAKVVSIEAASSAGGTLRFIATTPAQITANQDNYNPGGSSYQQRWSSDASRNVTGMTFTAAQVDGQTHLITNVGAQDIVLKEQVTSTAANQFMNSTGADITLSAKQSAYAIYDSTVSRWRVFKMN